MKPYSMDLRERVIRALENGDETHAEIAERFGISKATVDHWWLIYQAKQDITPAPHGGGRTRKLAVCDDFIRAEVKKQSDVTLDELCARVATEKKIMASGSMMSRTVTLLNLPRKKKTLHDCERDTPRVMALRDEFTGKIEAVFSPKIENIKFTDEFGLYLGMTRLYGRAAPGERIYEGTLALSGDKYTGIAVMGLDGMTAPYLFKGNMNREIFEHYVEHYLVPTLHPGEILIMDNLSSHKSERARQLIIGCGVRIEMLPPYSPDFNPIEHCWSKVKAWLRTAKAATYDALISALASALRAVSLSDINGWLANCDYI